MKMNKMILAASLILSSLNAFADVAVHAPLTEVTIADGRKVLADSEGMTVYTFDPDTTGTSTCYDKCAQAWPAVLVDANAVLGSSIKTHVRKDGDLQLTVNEQPVYLFVGDKNPGDIKGDGLGGVWHIIEVR